MRGGWRESLGEVEERVEYRERGCEGEAVDFVVVDFGDLGESVGK